MLNLMANLEICILGRRKSDELCEPLQLQSSAFKFLRKAFEIFKKWNSSGCRGLTNETFLACIQTIEAMLAMTEYMLAKNKLTYILTGKFSSDPIEGRFGWYRQANGGNFFMSLKQLLQVEKKIRCISLLQQHALQGASKLVLLDDLPMKEDEDASEGCLWLQEYLAEVILDQDDSDISVVFFVSGYIARSISRRRKCDGCKELLIKSDDCPSIQTFVEGEGDRIKSLLELADRGGLAVPTDYCFVICLMATQAYEKIVSNDATKKKFMAQKNHRGVFIKALRTLAQSSEIYNGAISQTCSKMHNNFSLILQTAFNCFAKNELKRLNNCIIDAPAKMQRIVRKLTAKSSAKQ